MVPAARIRSATSSGGRAIYFAASESASSGLAVAPMMALRQVDVNHGFAQVGVAEQQLDGAQVGAGFEQMCGEAVAKGVRMERLVDAGAFGGFPTGVPDDLVADGVIGGVPCGRQETAKRQVCGSVGDNVRAVHRADGG